MYLCIYHHISSSITHYPPTIHLLKAIYHPSIHLLQAIYILLTYYQFNSCLSTSTHSNHLLYYPIIINYL